MKQNTRFQVIKELRARIVSLELPPGTPISENELAAQLGVSRTPIREAILLLAEENLVEVFPRIGTFVTPVDVRLVADAQFLRESLELSSLDRLDLPLEGAPRDLIVQNLETQERLVQEDPEEFFKVDEEFHRLLMEAAGHGRSWTFVNNAKSHLDRARMVGLKKVSHPSKLFGQHVAVFDQLQAGNKDVARQLLQRHLQIIFDDIRTVAKNDPELFIGWDDENAHGSRKWNDFQYLPPDARMRAFKATQTSSRHP